MTGLEKMIGQITDEAEQSAKSTLDEARTQAEKLLEGAHQEADRIRAESTQKAETAAANYMDRVRSSADLKTRTAILQAKQEVIADVLTRACERIESLEGEAYKELIGKLLRKYVQAGEGELHFSPEDQTRIDAAFEKEIAAIAAEKGGTLKLGAADSSIGRGFVLVYGGVEENCTFRALFNADRDTLQDIAHKELFS